MVMASKLRAASVAIDRLSALRLFAVVAIPLFAIFLSTSSWSRGAVDIDGFTNVVTGWRIGTAGSVYLPEHTPLTHPDFVGHFSWIIAVDDTAIGKYPPGAALHAAPVYAVWPQEAEMQTFAFENRPDIAPVRIPVPPYGPSAIVSSLVVALAMGFLAISFRRFAGGLAAAGGAYVAGLGTSAWSVAADTLWQHGPGMMWIALAGTLTAGHLAASGIAYGVATLVRPLSALIAASTGLSIAWQDRDWRPVAKVGLGAAAGLLTLMVYNTAVYGQVSVLGGYGSGFVEQTQSLDLIAYVRNVGLALVSTSRGVLIWSSFLVILIPGIPTAWRAAPPWVRGGALGGAIYLLVLLKANRYSGGGGFLAYRYPLEALTAAAPLLFLSYAKWVAPRPRALRVFRWLAILSIAFHALFAVRF